MGTCREMRSVDCHGQVYDIASPSGVIRLTKLGGVVGPLVGNDVGNPVGNEVGVVVGVTLGTVVGVWFERGWHSKEGYGEGVGPESNFHQWTVAALPGLEAPLGGWLGPVGHQRHQGRRSGNG